MFLSFFFAFSVRSLVSYYATQNFAGPCSEGRTWRLPFSLAEKKLLLMLLLMLMLMLFMLLLPNNINSVERHMKQQQQQLSHYRQLHTHTHSPLWTLHPPAHLAKATPTKHEHDVTLRQTIFVHVVLSLCRRQNLSNGAQRVSKTNLSLPLSHDSVAPFSHHMKSLANCMQSKKSSAKQAEKCNSISSYSYSFWFTFWFECGFSCSCSFCCSCSCNLMQIRLNAPAATLRWIR